MTINKITIVAIFAVTILLTWSAATIVTSEKFAPKNKLPIEQQQQNIGNTLDEATNKGLASDFTLETLDGNKITLSDYRGKKPVILDFWASWCPNCQRNMPNEQKLYQKYHDQVEVLGINVKEDPAVVRKFVADNKITFPILMDKGDIVSLYGINYTNSHILISKDGQMVRTVLGDITEEHFKELILRN